MHPPLGFHGCIGTNGSTVHMSMARSLVPPTQKCMFQRYATLNRYLCSVNEPQWKALIIDRIKCGKLRQALTFYQKFQKDDASQPCRRTFGALLKACAKLKDVITGYKIHEHIARMGLLETDIFIGSSLVDMYAKCGLLPKAHQVFNRLLVRDAVLWTTLIAGYAESGHGEEALVCFEQMQLDGVSPDAVAFVYSLKACSSIGALDKGQEIHAQIERSELHGREEFVGSALIDMYAKFSSPFKAKEVFDNLLLRDIYTWTTLMSGYVEHGYNEEALKCYEKMQLEGISPDAHAFVCCLKACGNIRAVGKGQELHSCIEREGMLKTDLVLGNTLVGMYAKCGMLVRAQQVFDKLSARDVVSWTALISGYAEHGQGEEALRGFEHMQVEGICPNSVAYVCSLKVCGSLGAVDKGLEIHAQIEREDLLEGDLTVSNALISMYADCGVLAMAQQVFDTVPVRDVVSWTTIIAGYTEHGCGEEALKYFDLMRMKGFCPNSLTFVCSLKACGSMKALYKGLEIHNEIERKGISVDNDLVIATLIDMYTKCGALLDARQLFEKLPARDVVAWTILIAGYVEQGRGEEALECFQQMQIEGISPDVFTFDCSLKACGIIGSICYGQEIHAEIERKGLLEQDVVVGTALIDMYFKCGFLLKGQEVFDKLRVQDTISWTTLITGYVEQGYNEKALKCFHLMQELGVFPNAETFVCSLNACASIGAGQEIHAGIEREGLLEGDLVVGNALVDMYARLGLLAFARQVFNTLPLRDAGTWNALIGGYAEHDCGDLSDKCFQQMQLEGVSADAVTIVYILKACGSTMAAQKGQEVHALIDKMDCCVDNIFVGCALMDMYAKCGMLGRARQVFDKLPVRNVVSWTTFIAACVEHEHAREALECFERMTFEGVSPNAATFVCILKACCRIGAAEKGAEIHAEIERKGFAGQDTVVGNTLVDMYAKCGSLVVSQHVFDKLLFRDMVSWNALLAGYAQNGESENVFLVFNRMIGEKVEPDAVTFLLVLSACSLTDMFSKSYTYYESMIKHFSIVPTLEHHCCAVNLLCRAGKLDEAVALIPRVSFHLNLVLWRSVLSACKKYGHLEFGERAFEHTAY